MGTRANFLAATRLVVPRAKIMRDRFSFAQRLNEAVDKV